ncbi:PAB-dependent poly(A)-specific ribonuclease subunit pan3 [Microthyrium microscopicum]|uniref:PAN2-PAN3 deadenylation complex subunit PAN3 n=1 Tax=Microthyrium microscopicum TaxID=703497 RepID=A0A6A6UQ19_9PEZI|nr:PAB-dependent poly(A)-specific ribonuclease subunit pan3 [Microthyrium microscopicum]
MDTPIGGIASEIRRTMASPRPKGRENLKNTPCRNIGIFGFCKYEKDGCAYNHDASMKTKPQSHSTASSESTNTSRFNVDSPSFTPLQPQTNGLRPSAISPRSANAAPFTPKSSNSPLVSHARPKPTATEWTPQEVAEFVPQGFDPNQGLLQPDTQNATGLGSGFDAYTLHSALQSMAGTPQPQINNPYLQDPSGGLSGATYYQNSGAFTQPLQYHLYSPLAPHRDNLLAYQRTSHDFFISEDLRREFQRRNEASLQVLPNSTVLPHLDHFHSLVPLDTLSQKNSNIFGYPTWIYKAVSSKDGKTYALRRLEGYRLTNEHAIRALQPWKRIDNGSMVTVHDVFTTRAFGDSSLIFVMDYHPCSSTLAEHHFPQSAQGRNMDRFGNPVRAYNPQYVSEQTLWAYMAQLASALKIIHAGGLAAQVIHPSKILLTGKNRIRLNACGILDVVKFDASQVGMQRSFKLEQQEDLVQLGRLILCIAAGNASVYLAPHKALDGLSRAYTGRLRDCISWLLSPPQEQTKSIDILLSEISGNIITVLDNQLHAFDTFESALATSLEDGRIARILLKMNLILERPENEHNHSWSETGERYYIKMFRDYVFHAVDAQGRALVDLSHILGCLNRLDAGSNETIQLTSRDGETAFIVTFKDIKRAIENSFSDLNGNTNSSGLSKGRK